MEEAHEPSLLSPSLFLNRNILGVASPSLLERALIRRKRNRYQWKGRLISSGGQFLLVNAVLGAATTYWLSLSKMPVQVRKRIESRRSRFLWSGTPIDKKKYHFVSWEKVCMQKKRMGGLGVLNLKRMNQAGKW
jgi:hypothetical protein